MTSEIPGLIRITDETGPDGSCRLNFELADDRVGDFFAAFGLQEGDVRGLQDIVVGALTNYIEAHGAPNDKSTG